MGCRRNSDSFSRQAKYGTIFCLKVARNVVPVVQVVLYFRYPDIPNLFQQVSSITGKYRLSLRVRPMKTISKNGGLATLFSGCKRFWTTSARRCLQTSGFCCCVVSSRPLSSARPRPALATRRERTCSVAILLLRNIVFILKKGASVPGPRKQRPKNRIDLGGWGVS